MLGIRGLLMIAACMLLAPRMMGQTLAAPVSFGSVSANSGTPALATVRLTVSAGGLVSGPKVLTDGAAGLDFMDQGTGTCTMNGSQHLYAESETCTVEVQFAPKFPGMTRGAVELENSEGAVVALAYVSGTGVGPLVGFVPSQTARVGSGFQRPGVVIADAAGNLYVADQQLGEILRETPTGSGTYTQSVAVALLNPESVAVDGAGSLYVASGVTNNLFEVVKETPGPFGTYTASTVYSTVGEVMSVTVDGNAWYMRTWWAATR